MGAKPASALVRDLAVLLLAGVLSLGALLLAAGAWLGLLRSEGLVFLLPPIIYLAWNRRWLATSAVAALVAALALGQDMGAAAGAQDMMSLLRQGVVMWDMSALPPPPDLAGAVVTGPAHFYWLVAFSHPGWLMELMALRVSWLLLYAYPPHHPLWYSIAAPVLDLALYLLAAWGTWRVKGHRGAAWLVWGFLAAAMAVAALTWVVSDGRFLTRPLCCLVFLAGLGVERLLPSNLMVGSGKILPKR
ncbi:MAG: hypothetical protein K9K65_11060 [Desulfarculaceae bacterium]|nr:hypothetical protein [Desulfarculaceae bacterium]MCF8098373.1 hypothetical protein [Desulfarculaceae bacterium]MCF8122864.1 hypothetical protein [Desulfarculaceae bacterium]